MDLRRWLAVGLPLGLFTIAMVAVRPPRGGESVAVQLDVDGVSDNWNVMTVRKG
jgi:hypothetical protein